MNKKGFVLVETVVVMTVVLVSLVSVYASYSLIITKAKQKTYYENINDVYKLNVIKNSLTIYNINEIKLITTSNCTDTMSSDCGQLFDDLEIDGIYILPEDLNLRDLDSSDFPNSLIRFAETLSSNTSYFVAFYEKDGVVHYTSLKVR